MGKISKSFPSKTRLGKIKATLRLEKQQRLENQTNADNKVGENDIIIESAHNSVKVEIEDIVKSEADTIENTTRSLYDIPEIKQEVHDCGEVVVKEYFDIVSDGEENSILSPVQTPGQNTETSSSKKSYNCHICKNSYSSGLELNHHMQTFHKSKRHSCTFCEKSYANKCDFYSHINCHIGENPYDCNLCGESFASLQRLRGHTNRQHSKIFKCSQCNKSLTTSSCLKQHQLIHAGVKPLARQCDICNKQLTTKSRLRIHMYIHAGIKPFKCTHCQKEFSDPIVLRRHFIRHGSGRAAHSCVFCDKGFPLRTELENHIYQHIGERPNQVICRTCDAFVKCRRSLKRHIKVNCGVKRQCMVCNSTLLSGLALQQHKQTFHSNEMPFSCIFCGKRYQKSSKYFEHIRYHIRESRCFECKFA